METYDVENSCDRKLVSVCTGRALWSARNQFDADETAFLHILVVSRVCDLSSEHLDTPSRTIHCLQIK